MGERSLSRAAAASRARAFQTSIICGGWEPAGTAWQQPQSQKKIVIGAGAVKHYPCAQLPWSPAAGGHEYTQPSNVGRIHSTETGKNQLPIVSSSCEQAWAKSPPARNSTLSPKREDPCKHAAVSENQAAHSDASLTSELHQPRSSIGEPAASRKLAGHITWRISNARTWPEVAAITHEFGGASALNDIHLSAALSRLAKLDISLPLPPAQLPAQPPVPYLPHQCHQRSAPLTHPAPPPQTIQAPQSQQRRVHNPLPPPLHPQIPASQRDTHLRSPPHLPPTAPHLGWPSSSPPTAPTPPRSSLLPPSLSRDHLAPPPPPPPTAPLQLTRWSHGAPYHSSPQPPGPGPSMTKPPGAPALGRQGYHHGYQEPTSLYSPASVNSPATTGPLHRQSAQGPLPEGDTAAHRGPPLGQRSGSNTPHSGSYDAIGGMGIAATPAISVEELFLGLLDSLAEQYGATRVLASGGSGIVRRGTGTAAGGPLGSPSPRVLANAVWAAVRLLLQLRHRLMGDGSPTQRNQQQKLCGGVLEEWDMHMVSRRSQQVSVAADMTLHAAAEFPRAGVAAATAGLADEASKAAARIDYVATAFSVGEEDEPALGTAGGEAARRMKPEGEATCMTTMNGDVTGTTAPKGWGYRRARTALVALLSRVPEVVRELEPQHTSSLLYSLAQLAQEAPDVLAELGTEAGAGGVGLAVSGSGEAGVASTPISTQTGTRRLVRALLESSLPKLETFGPQSLSNSVYAVARMGVSPPAAWMRVWRATAGGQMARADPQHIANMLWSCVRLGFHPGDEWLRGALRSAALKAPAFTAEGLCITLWSITKLRPKLDTPSDAAALRRLVLALRAAAPSCGGQDVANGLYTLAQLQTLLCGPVPQVQAPASLSTSSSWEPQSIPPAAEDLPPQAAHARIRNLESHTVGASAGVVVHGQSPSIASSSPPSPRQQPGEVSYDRLRDTTLVALQTAAQMLLSESCRHLHSYTAQQLANTAWAAAALGLAPPADWVAQFWPAALTLLPHMRAEELAATAVAAARLGLSPPSEWFDAMLRHTAHAMQPSAGTPIRDSAGGDGGDGMGEKGTASAGGAFRPTDRTLAGLLWSVAAWRVRVPLTWAAAVLGQLEVVGAKGSLGTPALASVMQSLARKRLNPDAIISGWTQRMVEGHVRDALHESDDRAARIMLWSLARLRCRVSDEAVCVLALRAAGCGGKPVASEAVSGARDVRGMRDKWALYASTQEGGGHDALTAMPPTAGIVDGDGMVDVTRGAADGLPRVEEAVNVCLALRAVAMLECMPSRLVMRELVMRAVTVLPVVRARELVTMMHSLAVLRFRPGPRFLGPFEDSIVRLGGAFDSEQASILLSCCNRLGIDLNAQALAALDSPVAALYGRVVGQRLC